jgi:predicted RNA-binding protein with PIN domain
VPATFIIDGYNLIHALGMIRKDAGPGGLEKSRIQLLQFLAKSFGNDASNVTVVFDAERAPRRAERQQVLLGINVHFAPKGQSADDWIETLIREHTAPKQLVLVSNDARLERAAKQRGALGWSHEQLLDYFDRQRVVAGDSEAVQEKQNTMSPEEVKAWHEEFADLETDPELKEFFEMDRFE